MNTKSPKILRNAGTLVSDASAPKFFAARPDFLVVSRFIEHVSRRGNPHHFPGVVDTKPPQVTEFFWLTDEIKLPGSQVSCACPWCSNGKPKFKTGRLLYFPQEAVMRFVGRCCARTHLDADVYARADKTWKEEKRRLSRDDFLRTNCCNVARYLELAEQLTKCGSGCDHFYESFSEAPGGIHSNIARYVRSGELFVDDRRTLQIGAMQSSRRFLGRLTGVEVFKKSPKLAKTLKEVVRQLKSIERESHRARGGELAHLPQKQRDALHAILQQAFTTLMRASRTITSFQSFLRSDNIDLLRAWCCHPDSDISHCGIDVWLNSSRELEFRFRIDRYVSSAKVSAWPVMLKAISEIPPLEWKSRYPKP